MGRSILAAVIGALVLQSSPALAATVRIDEGKGVLVYRAAPGERNDLRIARSGTVWVSDSDSVRMHAGRGCDPVDRITVQCDPAVRAVIRLGNENDRARLFGYFDSALVEGGRGDDRLIGGRERDELRGGDGTDLLIGGRGVDRLMADWQGVDNVTEDRLRGGPGSDMLVGSAGPNLIQPGPGVNQVYSGRGRDIVLTRDGSVEQIHCGAGEDSAVTDGFDFPLACEHHEPYSRASPVPLEFAATAGESRASVLFGCREAHPAGCAGTIQLELGDRALSEERPFTYANRHRLVILLDTLEPIPPDGATRPDLAIRIRARDASGVATDDRYPVQAMLVGSPFVG